MTVGRPRLAIRRLRHRINVLVSKLGTSSRCTALNRLYENIAKYAFLSRLWVSLYNIGPTKLVPMSSKAAQPWVTVQSVGSSPGGGTVTGETLKSLQPLHADHTAFPSCLRVGIQYSSRITAIMRDTPPCKVSA